MARQDKLIEELIKELESEDCNGLVTLGGSKEYIWKIKLKRTKQKLPTIPKENLI